MIKVSNLTAEYPGKRVLHHLNFEVKPNTITALVGPNGAGKTTLLKLLSGLESPFAGQIIINGIDIEENPRSIHKTLGFLPDFFGLYHNLTVKQCLEYAALSHNVPSNQIQQSIDSTVSLLDLGPYLDKQTQTLSRGYRQRLALAQTIIFKPKLLLLDEPASGLDPESRVHLSQLMLKLRDQGLTILVSSHILSELEDYCSEMLIIREGHISHYQSDSNNIDISSTQHSSKPVVLEISLIGTIQELHFYYSLFKDNATVSDVDLNQSTLSMKFTGSEEQQADILKTLLENKVGFKSVKAVQDSLQDIYLKHQRRQDKTGD